MALKRQHEFAKKNFDISSKLFPKTFSNLLLDLEEKTCGWN
jgi:hypothetical protein